MITYLKDTSIKNSQWLKKMVEDIKKVVVK
jgi:hypothetical protein